MEINPEEFLFCTRLKDRRVCSWIILIRCIRTRYCGRIRSVWIRMRWSVGLTCGRRTTVSRKWWSRKGRRSRWGRTEVTLLETWKHRYLLAVEDVGYSTRSQCQPQFWKVRRNFLWFSVDLTLMDIHFPDWLILASKCSQMTRKQANFHSRKLSLSEQNQDEQVEILRHQVGQWSRECKAHWVNNK